jgi:hypothetical protein
MASARRSGCRSEVVDPRTVMIAAGAVGAALVGYARLRPRRARVRREPIDVDLLHADFVGPGRTELEIVAALEAEVRRMHLDRATTDPPVPGLAVPAGRGEQPPDRSVRPGELVSSSASKAAVGSASAGLPLDQVRAWLEQVKADLRNVQARVEFLQFEQTRLQGQRELVSELMSSTTVG